MKKTPTEQIEHWIAEHGCARDALNVALARLEAAETRIENLCNELASMNDALFSDHDDEELS